MEIKDLTQSSCREFLSELAGPAPAPGGGGASALAGAVGTALCRMVASLTVGKEKYAAVEEEMQALLARCEALQEELLAQVPADAEGFLPLAAAYRIPQDDPARADTLEAASAAACRVPFRILELCREGLDLAAAAAEKGSRLAAADAGCAAAILKGAMEAAALNVFTNTRGLRDRERADEMNSRCLAMLDEGGQLAEAIFEEVKQSFLSE